MGGSRERERDNKKMRRRRRYLTTVSARSVPSVCLKFCVLRQTVSLFHVVVLVSCTEMCHM